MPRRLEVVPLLSILAGISKAYSPMPGWHSRTTSPLRKQVSFNVGETTIYGRRPRSFRVFSHTTPFSPGLSPVGLGDVKLVQSWYVTAHFFRYRVVQFCIDRVAWPIFLKTS